MEQQIDNIEQLYNKIPQQIIASFSSNQPQYSLQNQQLQISSDFDQQTLNKLVKDLLNRDDLPTFQFIVEDYVLRGKLKSHIIRYNLTSQNIINITYVIAFPELDQETKIQDQDWISSLSIITFPDQPSAVAASLYSGNISIFSNNLETLLKIKVENDPLKAVSFMMGNQQNTYFCFSGGLNQNLNVHYVSLNKGKYTYYDVSQNSCLGSINAINITPGADQHIATGTSQGQLTIWQVPQNFQKVGNFNSLKQKKKKKQINLNILPKLASQKVHEGTIQCLNWINNQQIATGSSQHQIGITNITKMQKKQTILTRDSIITSIDSSGHNILSSHQDGKIRLWDIRDPSRPSNTFKSHSKWTSSIKYCSNPFYFASGSYDHTVKIWDTRCSFPLQNKFNPDQQKVLSVQWLNNDTIVSGGSDSCVHKYQSVK